MNLYCIKCFKSSNSNNINIKREIYEKSILAVYCIGYGLKKFETIDK